MIFKRTSEWDPWITASATGLKTILKNKTVISTNILERIMLILGNTIKQIIKDLICEYWEEDVGISKTRMDELTRRYVTDESWVFFFFNVFRRLADQKNTWPLTTCL